MNLYNKLIKLASENNKPSVTISLNTHRTFPDRENDRILLKNLLSEAEERIIKVYGKRQVSKLLENLSAAEEKVDINRNLNSLHLFISDETFDIIRLTVPTTENRVYIADTFDVRTIIKAVNRTEEYLILILSQGGVNFYHAINECVLEEIKNDDFPFDANPYYTTDKVKQSDSKQMDNYVREYYNEIDKAVIKVSREKELNCIVISTEDNYALLRQVADVPELYIGFDFIDYDKTKEYQIGEQAWKVIKELQKKKRTKAIQEIKEAVGHGNVLTDLNEIYTAAKEGRGELLIVRDDYSQAVNINEEGNIETTSDISIAQIDDVISVIVWEIISKKGKVFFTCQDKIKGLGDVALKVRY